MRNALRADRPHFSRDQGTPLKLRGGARVAFAERGTIRAVFASEEMDVLRNLLPSPCLAEKGANCVCSSLVRLALICIR